MWLWTLPVFEERVVEVQAFERVQHLKPESANQLYPELAHQLNLWLLALPANQSQNAFKIISLHWVKLIYLKRLFAQLQTTVKILSTTFHSPEQPVQDLESWLPGSL